MKRPTYEAILLLFVIASAIGFVRRLLSIPTSYRLATIAILVGAIVITIVLESFGFRLLGDPSRIQRESDGQRLVGAAFLAVAYFTILLGQGSEGPLESYVGLVAAGFMPLAAAYELLYPLPATDDHVGLVMTSRQRDFEAGDDHLSPFADQRFAKGCVPLPQAISTT